MFRSIIPAICVISLAAPAMARPLDPAKIPVRAEVVVHVDVDALRASKLRRIFASHLKKGLAELERKLVDKRLPFHVSDITNLGSVTFWAEGDDHERGALIANGVDIRRVRAVIAKLAGYRRTAEGGVTVHQWKIDESPTYLATHGSSVIVADDKKSVLITVATLTGRAKSLAGTAKARRFGDTRGVLFVAVFAKGIANKIQRAADSAIFKKIGFKGGLIKASETRDSLVARAAIETRDATGANQLHRLAAGAISFFTVASDDPDLAKLIDALAVKSKGATVSFTLSLPFATIEKLLNEKLHGHGRGK